MKLIDVTYRHIIPFDGNFFDDPAQTISSLITINVTVLLLFTFCLWKIREKRKAERASARVIANATGSSTKDIFSKNLSLHSKPLKLQPVSSAGASDLKNKEKETVLLTGSATTPPAVRTADSTTEPELKFVRPRKKS